MSQSATTHPGPRPWIVSTASRRRWKWPPWWTLSRTVSHRSPSVGSVCSSGQPARGCTCPRHTPRPRRGSPSRAFFSHLSWTWQLWGFFAFFGAAQRGQLSSTSGLIAASNPGFLDVCWESSGAAQVVKSASVRLSCVAEQTLVSSSPPPL